MNHSVALKHPQPGAAALLQADNAAHFYEHWKEQSKRAREGYFGACHSRLLTGYALHQLKSVCSHGEFERLRKEKFPELPDSTAKVWQKDAWENCRANTELRKVTEALLLNREGERESEAFLAVAEPYFLEQVKRRQSELAASEMKLLNDAPPPKPAAQRKPRELSAEEKRKAEQARVLGEWDMLFEALHVVALPRSVGALAKLPANTVREVKRRFEIAVGNLGRQLKAIKD